MPLFQYKFDILSLLFHLFQNSCLIFKNIFSCLEMFNILYLLLKHFDGIALRLVFFLKLCPNFSQLNKAIFTLLNFFYLVSTSALSLSYMFFYLSAF